MKEHFDFIRANGSGSELDPRQSFKSAAKLLSPAWDTRDYVAVNPFFGFKNKNFLEASQYIKAALGASILPKREFFLKKYREGEITERDLDLAKRIFDLEFKENKASLISNAELVSFIEAERSEDNVTIKCLSDLYDEENQTNVTDELTKEISLWASAYFDEGQALWKADKKGKRFYTWWRNLCCEDVSIDEIKDTFPELVASLPESPEEALDFLVSKLTKKVNLSESELNDYFFRLSQTVRGWVSYIHKFEFEANRDNDQSELERIGGVIDIVVMRLTYDLALLEKINDLSFKREKHGTYASDILYIWLNAYETSYRREVTKHLNFKPQGLGESAPKKVQMAFCIDVRSEVLRRHLEAQSPEVETIGFAGFFGMPISVKGLGHKQADQNCPILLTPQFEVSEEESGVGLLEKKQDFVKKKQLGKIIKRAGTSTFSFAETMGFSYIKKLFQSTFGEHKAGLDFSSLGLNEKEKKHIHLKIDSISSEEKVEFAFAALKNMGLKKNFGEFIILVGHGSQSANNPYASALDCGACAGHNGHDNSKVLVDILNDNVVREELKNKGIDIPLETQFLSGWHNTTTDKITVDWFSNEGNSDEITLMTKWFEQASLSCQLERGKRLPQCEKLPSDELTLELQRRANDWSEIRPEWGLARNASFIVGRRELTQKMSLDGRAFLHNYEFYEDNDLSILELIMTAPMVVTNWINMQYYASTVNPKHFGAGNKTINNVVGEFGCIEGNEGDLLNGLCEQSVLYKGDYFHEPIRLQVFIEAETWAIDKVMDKHQLVRDLVENNWLRLISICPTTGETKIYHAQRWFDLETL